MAIQASQDHSSRNLISQEQGFQKRGFQKRGSLPDEKTCRQKRRRVALRQGGFASSAFTLLELLLVLSILGISYALLSSRSSSVENWREQTAIRELVESLSFLFHQAIADRAHYRAEFVFADGKQPASYRIGVMRPEDGMVSNLSALASDAGSLTLELASFLSPSIGDEETMIPPPNFPSMAEPRYFPSGLRLVDMVLADGKVTEGRPYIDFSPRGSADFGVIHLKRASGKELTIVVNPFTGLVKVYDDYQDFEWTYGRKRT